MEGTRMATTMKDLIAANDYYNASYPPGVLGGNRHTVVAMTTPLAEQAPPDDEEEDPEPDEPDAEPDFEPDELVTDDAPTPKATTARKKPTG